MSIESLIIKLTEDYPTEQNKIREIPTIITEIGNGNDISENVERLQQICNDLYNISSTENLIELQVIINEYRYKYDIFDPREVVNIDGKDKFVQ